MPEPIDLAVCDVSFISITMILPALAGLLANDAEMVILVKPQFELERHQVGKGGIIRDPALHQQACRRVEEAVQAARLSNRKSFLLPCWARKAIRSSSCMPDIKVVGIIAKPGIPHASAIVSELGRVVAASVASKRGWTMSPRAISAAANGLPREQVPEGAQLVIVLGGDGTLLAAARAVAGREIPIFPVNLGGLGFLTAITLDQLYPELECALCGEQRVVPRRMLHGEVVRDGKTVASYEALNDIVIGKTQIARMIDLETYVDSQYRQHLQSGRPDRRHAHRLHGLFALGRRTHRVSGRRGHLHHAGLPAHAHQSARAGSRHQRDRDRLQGAATRKRISPWMARWASRCIEDDRVVCRSSEHQVHLIRPPKMFFFDVLRQKLKWGER